MTYRRAAGRKAAANVSATAKNMIVVGAPRSGTSLTAGVFGHRGYFVGAMEEEHMREGDDGNPFGYFEADELIVRNVAVLRRAGFLHHNTWLFEMISETSIAAVGTLEPEPRDREFVQWYQTRSPWMWKDPRLCFTLRYWWRLMDPQTTGVILVRRPFPHIYNSFRRRGWCAEGPDARVRLEQRIGRHVRAVEEVIDSLRIPHLDVDYEDFLKRPERVAEMLSGFCGSTFTVEDLNVRPELNHTTLHGRLSSRLRASLNHGWLRHVKFLRPLVPRRALTLVFPEKEFENRANQAPRAPV